MNNQINNYSKHLNFYSNSSEAYNIYHKSRQIQKVPYITKKAVIGISKKPIYRITAKDTRHLISPSAMITVFIFFVGLIAMTVGFAANVEQQAYVRQLSNELRQIRNEVQVLEVEISQSYNLREIENIASLRLGMNKPAHHQIKYIEVHKPNTVVQYSTDEAVEYKSYFQRFLELLNL